MSADIGATIQLLGGSGVAKVRRFNSQIVRGLGLSPKDVAQFSGLTSLSAVVGFCLDHRKQISPKTRIGG